MKEVLIFAAVSEAATGLTLLIVPSLVGRLLLGEELTGIVLPVTLYLAYLGFAGGLNGILLWPAVVLHAVLSVLLARAWFENKQS